MVEAEEEEVVRVMELEGLLEVRVEEVAVVTFPAGVVSLPSLVSSWALDLAMVAPVPVPVEAPPATRVPAGVPPVVADQVEGTGALYQTQ